MQVVHSTWFTLHVIFQMYLINGMHMTDASAD